MKKILLRKSNKNLPVQKSSTITDINSRNLYLKRKAMQTPYQELFQALFRLPDRQVQTRVLEAINNSEKNKTTRQQKKDICYQCLLKKSYNNLVDASTQTTETHLGEKRSTTTINHDSKDNSTIVALSNEPIADAENDEEVKNSEDLLVVKKRKQRRKLREPQVIKKSQAKQVQQEQPKLLKRKNESVKSKGDNTLKDANEDMLIKRQRNLSVDLDEAIFLSKYLEDSVDSLKFVKEMMVFEYQKSEVIQADGLIPIHGAIMNNDYKGLKLQIYVWQKLKGIDLNEICTEEDEDCLQLAVAQNKSHEIVDVLIKSGLDVNSLDTQSNTIIHLAVLNDVNVEVLNLLMEKIDLNVILMFNDDGFTPLHLAVRQDNFLLAETILNIFDKRAFDCVFYEREWKETDAKEQFMSFYEERCEKLDFEKSIVKQRIEKQLLKRRLLDAGEMRSGNTALFYAIENKLDHLIYFLLAHFADPRIENHCGQTPRSYLSEFAKALNLSLKIDRVMDKIEIFLESS